MFYVPLLDNIERNISQELSPFGKSQHSLLPLLIFQLFVVVLEENRKRDHHYEKLIKFLGEFPCRICLPSPNYVFCSIG